ncbi:hypothetical protein VNO78_14160 [Psophocarpus tetragonolobus]|uniref:Uncharacterized protein n=1 Tax=Psophocarpus tetragonolobus TaxID=3891 RepID=A0AAN9SRZ1_PSOTE
MRREKQLSMAYYSSMGLGYSPICVVFNSHAPTLSNTDNPFLSLSKHTSDTCPVLFSLYDKLICTLHSSCFLLYSSLTFDSLPSLQVLVSFPLHFQLLFFPIYISSSLPHVCETLPSQHSCSCFALW